MSSARLCGEIILVENGVIIEEGKHKEFIDLGKSMQLCGKNSLEKRRAAMKKCFLLKERLDETDNNEKVSQIENNEKSSEVNAHTIYTIGSYNLTLKYDYCLYKEGKKICYIEYKNIVNIEHVYFSPDARWGLGIGLSYHVIVLNNGILKIQCKNKNVANEIIDFLSLKCKDIKVNKNILNVDLSWDNYFEKFHSKD